MLFKAALIETQRIAGIHRNPEAGRLPSLTALSVTSRDVPATLKIKTILRQKMPNLGTDLESGGESVRALRSRQRPGRALVAGVTPARRTSSSSPRRG